MGTRSRALIGTTGPVLWRGEAGYEDARRAVVWNARKPDRYPDVIVVAMSEGDVVAAVRHAASHKLKLAVRSGGHSLCGAAVRDGGLLLDLSGMTSVAVDAAKAVATVQPAVTGSVLARELAAHGLAFPVGHCGSVAMGGYLLSGGFGWNMGAWGPACFSVRKLRIVTSDGQLVEASPDANAELFWAARGAGSGFFGVVTSFELAVHPLPTVIRKGVVVNPLSEVGDVSSWAAEVASQLPEYVEFFTFLATAPPGLPADSAGKSIGVAAVAFADTEQQATDALAFLQDCPAASPDLACLPTTPESFASLHEFIGTFLPQGKRFAEDAVWCDQGLPVLLPALAEHVARAPAPGSHILAPVIRPRPGGLPDAALSLVARSLILCYGVWEDEIDDAKNEHWHRETVRSLDRFTIGHYIAESDLLAAPHRAAQSFSPAAWARLSELRQRHDPAGVFHTYLGV